MEEELLLLDKLSEKSVFNSEDIQQLSSLSKSTEPEVRAYAAELLAGAFGSEAKSILLGLCGDSDELVRVNACDSLSEYGDSVVFERLRDIAENDGSLLVRTYALLSLSDIGETVGADKSGLKALFDRLSHSENTGIKTACRRGLYRLGEKENLSKITDLLSSENYGDRCMAANTLGDLTDSENYAIISKTANDRLKKEDSEAVIGCIKELLKRIKEGQYDA